MNDCEICKMSSTKKNTCLPGFKIDPLTGKYVPIPVDFAALFSERRTKRVNKEWSNLWRWNDSHSDQPTKFPKTEAGVRKKLFTVPLKTHGQMKSTKDTRSRPSGRSPHWTVSSKSELIEEPIKSQGYSLKSLTTAQVKFSANTKEDETKTPDSLESFLQLELLCRSPIIKQDSPVSSVCNMCKNNMLINSEKENTNIQLLSRKEFKNNKEIILEIRRRIRLSQEQHQDTSRKIKELLEIHEMQDKNLTKMINLVDKLQDESRESSTKRENDEENENSAIKRRPLRLQNKSPAKNTSRPAGSPVFLKSVDLRKSTLTKSLDSKCQKYQIESPRMQKAIDMYNATRSVCSTLLTPKVSRSELAASPRPSNWRDNLSFKVQEQCLLLQDTPGHK